MVAQTESTMAQGRALLTERERELLASDDEDEEQYRYQTASRVRRRIQDELGEDIAVLEEHHPQLLGEFRGVACADEQESSEISDDRGYAALNELEAERVRRATRLGKREKLEFVLESLHDADELKSGLDWKSDLWADCTVEEVLGALLEAEAMLDDEQEFMATEGDQ